MILDTGYPQNFAGKILFDLFIETLDSKILTQIKRYFSERKCKFEEGRELYFMSEMPILLADDLIKFDVADSDLSLFLGNKKYERVEFNY